MVPTAKPASDRPAGALLVFAQGSALAPFIYTIF